MENDRVRRPRGKWTVAAALIAAMLLGIGLLWARREPIARDYVDRALAARGVQARYRITRFAISGQRLEDIVIGDPAAPDLTAAWAEIGISYGLGWPRLHTVKAHGVRLRGRLVHGKLSLGALDRLMPPSTGAPITLPDLHVDLDDGRMRLDTPYGAVGLSLEGRGNLADGFVGRLAAVTRTLSGGGCTATGATAFLHISISRRRPAIDGPLRSRRIDCATAGLRMADAAIAVDATGNEALAEWRGSARLSLASVDGGNLGAKGVAGRLAFGGTAAGGAGSLALRARSVRGGPVTRGRMTLDGAWRAGAASRFVGSVRLEEAALAPALAQPIVAARDLALGTPVGPLWRQVADALARAGQDVSGSADVSFEQRGGTGAVRATSVRARSGSGIVAGLHGGGIEYLWPEGRVQLDGEASLSGGGLPAVALTLHRPVGGGRADGEARIAPFAVDGARLVLSPVRFAIGEEGNTRLSTIMTLDGPLADGRVAGLTLPIEARTTTDGFVVGERCVPLTFARLEIAGLRIGAARLPLCPAGGALLAKRERSGLTGGATIARPRLSGRIGDAPATIVAERLGVTVGQPGFAADGVEVRIGAGETVTRFDVDRLNGTAAADGIGGIFTGAGGHIGAVPLLLTQGAGGWRFARGVLTLDGHLRVADRAATARFNPLESDDVRLRLEGGRIVATGKLIEPRTRTGISDVAIAHDLSSGIGNAMLAVPGITFGEALQPESLTPLTLGVVANVRGTVSGRGDIRWTPNGASSDGDFRTEALSLAAAFGPVTGVKGGIHFSDLLALATPPGQTVSIGEVNPGVAVTDGIVRYQLLPGQQVRLEGGRWPFSGGELILDPSLLDFGRPSERRMTFHVNGLDSAQFVQQFALKNVALTGTFDGILPMLFDATGGRIVGGRLAVRKGGGTLAYVGEVSNADLGMFARLAFDALKSMRYDALAIELDGALDGELVSRVLFNGTNETPKEARGGLLSKLTGLPFRFNITIRAPFRGLLNSAQSLSDPRALIGSALPKAATAPPQTVQPQESEIVP